MFRRFSVNFALFSMLLDALVVALSLLASTYLRDLSNTFDFVKPLPGPISIPFELYAVFPILWVGVLLLVSVYDGRRNLRVVDEYATLTFGALLAAVSMAGVLYLSYRDISRFLFLLFVALAYLAMLVWRGIVRLAFRWDGLRAVQKRRVLIVGAGETGRRLGEQIEQNGYLGLALAGFLDDDPGARSAHADVLGPLDNVHEAVQAARIDDVVVALPRGSDQRLNWLVAVLHDLPVKVWVIPDYFSLALHRASVEEFANIPMLDLRAPALNDYQRMVKRAFDLIVTLVLMPFLLPVMALIAVAIRLDSPGPVFFRQKRVGENGRPFDMIKFRTMVADAEDLRHLVESTDENGRIVQNKSATDPRVTPVGRFLRRTSLDELPQSFNVLKGDMSLIGPRPEMPYLVEQYELWQRKRFAIPPGITGWWQVSGRSERPMHLHTEDDLYYVQHYSIWLDLQILLKTVWVVLRGRGAY